MKSIFELESNIYASLSHPKRLEILHLLSHKDLSVGELVAMTGLTQASVSQHLMTLKKLLLVRSQKHAQSRIYSLTSPHIASLLDSARSLLVDSNILPEVFIDPICQMEVTKKSSASSLTVNGKTYYFCGTGCENQFRRIHVKQNHPNI